MSEIQPKIIIHGGTGGSLKTKGGVAAVRKRLQEIITEVYDLLLNGGSAVEAVVRGAQLMEDESRFNAGTGSVLQSDGQIRMTASLMDGTLQNFSGVINVSRIQNPILMAKALQGQEDRIVSDYGASQLARELQLPIYDPITDFRLQEWMEERKTNFTSKMARVVAEHDHEHENPEARHGTIGVVALDKQGKLAVATSTGGKGLERIGRVGDSATPAGNYATNKAAVSCTGVGEDIIDFSFASRVVIRATDGLSLLDAMKKSIEEAAEAKRDLAAIALDATGAIVWGKTCEILIAAYHDGKDFGDTLELAVEEQFGTI